MSKINWTVRAKNKAFWVALIPAVLLLVQVVAAVFMVFISVLQQVNDCIAIYNAGHSVK